MRLRRRTAAGASVGDQPVFVQRHGLRILEGEDELREALARMATVERSLAGMLSARAERHESLLGSGLPSQGSGSSRPPVDAGGGAAPLDAVPRASGAASDDPSMSRPGAGSRAIGGRASRRSLGCQPGPSVAGPPPCAPSAGAVFEEAS